MACWILSLMTIGSIGFGFTSAAAWLYASNVKVTHEQVIVQRKKDAILTGEVPDLGGVSLDGWDMSATFAAQAKWNSRGAALAACAVSLQALSQALSCV
ncbi:MULTISPECIES: hypothetical protein [Janthinobacterium]|uniref:hypothetical protein n=1 Tax=Janthinobacterium TaxID=29580 RepID=UPI001C5AF05A|nr:MULTISPECIES: hypothetical protein [Janthinobacterium]MBW3509552.1 hypothetical protein [Janthinobacterium sp. NKUCC06_STL]MCA1859672.1 hypothetical protein [Janthinobacterium lividum]